MPRMSSMQQAIAEARERSNAARKANDAEASGQQMPLPVPALSQAASKPAMRPSLAAASAPASATTPAEKKAGQEKPAVAVIPAAKAQPRALSKPKPAQPVPRLQGKPCLVCCCPTHDITKIF